MKALSSKIALGTVQFGLDYGINNKTGRVPVAEVERILRAAKAAQIDLLDTASAYGQSENVLGSFAAKPWFNFKIVSKLPACQNREEASALIQNSISRLHVESLYGYLFHDFGTFRKNPKIYKALKQAKADGQINKIGFSLYYPRELDLLLGQKIDLDILQVPYSVFDQRFASYFANLHKAGVEIHVRSVFLQGLVFMQPNNLPHHLTPIAGKLERLQLIAKENDIPIESLCLNFAIANNNIDCVVIGVDSQTNLTQNVAGLSYLEAVSSIEHNLASLQEEDESIIIPANWKKS